MQYKTDFMNKTELSFLEIGLHDEPELMLLGSQPARNISIELDALACLRFFPQVERLILRPGSLVEQDLCYLRDLPIITLKLDYYSTEQDIYTIDLAQFPKLQYVFSRTQHNFRNIEGCKSLYTLVVQEWYGRDLQCLQSTSLYALSIFSGRLRSLSGIQNSPNLRSLALANQQNLSDLCDLQTCCALESLSIESCSHADVTQITALPHLQYLRWIGKQRVRDLSFLSRFPALDHVILDIVIEDGQLDVLLQYSHSVILTDRRHYSRKNRELPKAKHRYCSPQIPRWLEILPQA